MPTHLIAHLVALSLTTSVATYAADWHVHNGKIVDAATNMALGDATATAASSNRRLSSDDECPKYDGFIDDDVSKSDGTFTLRIPTGNTSYVVTYCRNSYEAFTPPANDNIDGAPVAPRPVRLWPHAGSDRDMYAALGHVAEDAKTATVSLATNMAVFVAATNTLPSAEQALIRQWVPLPEPTTVPAPETVAQAAATLSQALASLQTTLRYFATSSPSHFRSQVPRIHALSEYARRRDITPDDVQPDSPPTRERPPEQILEESPAPACIDHLDLHQVIETARRMVARGSPRAALANCFRPALTSTAFRDALMTTQEQFLFEYFLAARRAIDSTKRRNPNDTYLVETERVAKIYIKWYASNEQHLPVEVRRISDVIFQLGDAHAEHQEWGKLNDAYTDIAREHPRFLRDVKVLLLWHAALEKQRPILNLSPADRQQRSRVDSRYRDWCVFLEVATALDVAQRDQPKVSKAIRNAKEVIGERRCERRERLRPGYTDY